MGLTLRFDIETLVVLEVLFYLIIFFYANIDWELSLARESIFCANMQWGRNMDFKGIVVAGAALSYATATMRSNCVCSYRALTKP